MRWPWSTREKRQASYSEAVSNALLAVAKGVGNLSQTGAVETAASTIGKALALSKISPLDNRTSGLTAPLLASIGRQLVVRGEAVFVIEIRAGAVRLIPASSFDVSGNSPFPEDWTYRCDVFSPSASRTLTRTSEEVLHFRYSYDPGSPWRGVGPLTRARLTAALAANLESGLSNQASAPTGQLIPVPNPGAADTEDGDPLSDLKDDLARISGGTLLIETTAGAWGDGRAIAPKGDWESRRIGFDPSRESGLIREQAALAVLSACGIPPSLVSEKAEGTAQREGLRRFINLTLQPLGKILEAELSDKLDADVTLNVDAIQAGDLTGKARAMGSMVKAGMDLEKAVSLAGLRVE